MNLLISPNKERFFTNPLQFLGRITDVIFWDGELNSPIVPTTFLILPIISVQSNKMFISLQKKIFFYF